MLLYIDYLDHITSGAKSINALGGRLRYDLLIFGRDTLCMSVPACIKLESTTALLMELDEFWKNGKILLQLDRKHNGNPANYFNNRKRILSKGMSEEKLLNHFEFVAYESKRTDTFFRVYLPEMAHTPKEILYLAKEKDTDALFRNETIEQIANHAGIICRALGLERSICFMGMANRIQCLALDKTSLFQRSLVEDIISAEFAPQQGESIAVATLLDRAFALANAGTSNAIPISLILNQLTGRWLQQFLSKVYPSLHSVICGLSWTEVFSLSQDKLWQDFISFINVFIGVVQDGWVNKYDSIIEMGIHKLSHSMVLLSAARLIKKEAVDAVRNKLFYGGYISEAQNLELIIDTIIDAYGGKYRAFLDVLYAIDICAKMIEEKLKMERKYSYLLDFERSRVEREFEILK